MKMRQTGQTELLAIVRCMAIAARERSLAREARNRGCLVLLEADGATARARFQDPCVRASFGHEP